MAFRVRKDGSPQRTHANHGGTLTLEGYKRKSFDEDSNIKNDPLGKLYATRDGRAYGFDVEVRVDADQRSHPNWPDIQRKLIDAGATLVEVKESDANGWYDLIWYENGEIVEKLDVGVRGDWQNPSGMIYQKDTHGEMSYKRIGNYWMACIGNDYFPFDKANFFYRKFNKFNAKDQPTLVVEYAFDGSRSYRIDFEDGKKYPPVLQKKHNNEDDASIQVPISEVEFFKWEDGMPRSYIAKLMTKEQCEKISRERFNESAPARRRSN